MPRDRLGSIGPAFYPYGEEYATTTQNLDKFATYYRDGTTALDYARNRYYSSTLGRFMSADPGPANLADPGSWNRYSYAETDPIHMVDVTGSTPTCIDSVLGGTGTADSPCGFGQIEAPGGYFFIGPDGLNKKDALTRRAMDDLNRLPVSWMFNNTANTFSVSLSDSAFDLLDVEDLENAVKLAPPQVKTGVFIFVVTVAAVGKVYDWYNSRPKVLPDNCPPSQRIPTPTNPGNATFDPVRGYPDLPRFSLPTVTETLGLL